MRRFVPLLVAVLAMLGAQPVAAAAEPIAFAADRGSSFKPVDPVRVLDTRNGTGGVTGPVTGGFFLDLSGQVPSLATAVVLNVTGTEPTADTFIQVAPTNINLPDISNLNLTVGETRANQVTVAVLPDRRIFFTNNIGTVHLIADLAGYYTIQEESGFTSTPPTRLVDTRSSGPVGPGGSIELDLSGRVPGAATAVTFNLTGTEPTAGTHVIAYPSGATRPTVSNLNLMPGQTSPNLVTVALGPNRRVTLFNHVGNVHLIADLAGFYATDQGDKFYPTSPVRALDSRLTGGPVGPGGNRVVNLATRISPVAAAAVVNLTGTNASTHTFVTAYPTGTPLPNASNLNLAPQRDTANGAVVRLGRDAQMTLFNHVGSTDVVVDVAGFFANAPHCVADCLYGWGGYWEYGVSPGIRRWQSEVTSAAASYETAYTRHSDGTVWAWGGNQFGQLGAGGTGGDSKVPLRVAGLSGVTAIAAGTWAGYALKSDGTVWAWGRGEDGQLGYGGLGNSNVPVQVYGLTGVTAIAGSHQSAYALKSDGTVWAWGSDVWDELGNGACPAGQVCPPNTPVRVSVPLPSGTRITAIAGGASSTAYALRSDGTVWAWGRNWRGETGTGSPTRTSVSPSQVVGLTGVVTIGAGTEVGYAVTADGTMWSWGDDYWGTLGTGAPCTEPNNGCQTNVPVQMTGLTGAVEIDSSNGSTFARKADGTLWAWGRHGEAGNLGIGFPGVCSGGFPLSSTCRMSTPQQFLLTGVSTIAAGGIGHFAVVPGRPPA
jgi:alpha-tubulin suppressor-like RCC1 family protein